MPSEPVRKAGHRALRIVDCHHDDGDKFLEARDIPRGVVDVDHTPRRAYRLYHGDCLAAMRTMPANSVDAVVCDPPYGLGFMSKKWDKTPPGAEFAEEAFRVLKPGGYIIAFASTRTDHHIKTAFEQVGFEIRDTINWCYWQGFPKGTRVSYHYDKHIERDEPPPEVGRPPPITDEAKAWDGWHTGLKPSVEPAVLARKPPEGDLTVADNVLKWGTGALNIDACRYAYNDTAWPPAARYDRPVYHSASGGLKCGPDSGVGIQLYGNAESKDYEPHDDGWWPANIYHTPKPQKAEREAGLDDFEAKITATHRDPEKTVNAFNCGGVSRRKNTHPTVKSLKLMRWLCRLVTPPGGVVLDPFMGSGTTGCAAVLEGFDFIGCERSPLPPDHPAYAEDQVIDAFGIAQARIKHWREIAKNEEWERRFGSVEGMLSRFEE